MPIDTFFVYTGIYTNLDDAIADYDAVTDLHTEARPDRRDTTRR